jgi:hypothetical protein
MKQLNRGLLVTKSFTSAFSRSTLRQPVFIALLLVSPLLGLVIRPMPGLLGRYLPNFDFEVQVPLILAVVAGFPAYLFGLLGALMLLDERDRDLLPAFQVTPISDRGLLSAKVVPAMMLAFAGTPCALLLSGQVHSLTPGAVIIAAFIAAPSAAFYALLAASLAGNKVQGITIGKIMGTALPAPVLLVLIPGSWRYAALIFPPSWAAGVFMNVDLRWPWIIGGLVYVSVLAVLAWNLARKRYFKN